MCARKLLSHNTGSLARPPCACFITFPLHRLCLQAVATANASLFVYDTIFTNVHTMHTTGGHNNGTNTYYPPIGTNGTNTYYPIPASCGTPLPGRHLLLLRFLVLTVDRFRFIFWPWHRSACLLALALSFHWMCSLVPAIVKLSCTLSVCVPM